MSRAGLREEEKPIGYYLFTGPTGVGKTEVANNLPRYGHGTAALRYVMNIWKNMRSARLIGAPPGYVGFDQGGILTDAVDNTRILWSCSMRSKKPIRTCINILLQVMDYGKSDR